MVSEDLLVLCLLLKPFCVYLKFMVSLLLNWSYMGLEKGCGRKKVVLSLF